MKKLFNLRFMFLYFIVAILGIIFARATLYVPKFSYAFLIFLVFASLNLLVFTILFYKKYAQTFIHITTTMLVFLMTFASCVSYSSMLERDAVKINSGVYALSGEVTRVDYSSGVVYLKDLYIQDRDVKLFGEAKIYWHESQISDDILRGDKLSLSGHLYTEDVNSSFIGNSQTVTVFSKSEGSVEVIESTKIKDKIKRSVYKRLCETNANAETVQIQFAMLFGDKARLDDRLQESYSMTGLAHILAVSGLHVGFVVSIIYSLLKKLLKNKYWLTLLITSTIILAYLYLCDFATSAVRAVIMTIIVYYALSRGKQYDSLCGLSFAGVVILILLPFDLFDVGFQLSFAVVFALFCLSPPIEGLLSSKMPKTLASTIAVCVSTFLGSLLIVAYYFKSCSPLAILSNMIIIPFVSISFTILFVFVILATIVIPLDFILVIPNTFFDCINIVVNSIANLKISSVLLSTNFVGVILGLLTIFILSDYVFLTRNQKACIAGILVCLIGMTIVYSNYRIIEGMAEVLNYEIC